jgi:hypothetical protein
MVVHFCNLNMWEAEAGGLQVWRQRELHSEFQEFQASLGYVVKPCLKKKKKKKKEIFSVCVCVHVCIPYYTLKPFGNFQ